MTGDGDALAGLAARLEDVARSIGAARPGAPELRDLASEAVALASQIGEALPAALRDDADG